MIFNLFPPSNLSFNMCNKGGPRVGNSAWLNAVQQRRHKEMILRLKVLVAIYLNNT